MLSLMTGSVILPVKAPVMNLLTLSAAFGLLVRISLALLHRRIGPSEGGAPA